MSRGFLEATSARPRENPFLDQIELCQGRYRARLASNDQERRSVFSLRFEVFNLELNEGIDTAFRAGQDIDEFDDVCDHLIVEHATTGHIVGTYRLRTGKTARENAGYYSEREFDFAPYDRLRSELLELGRACIHRDHRSTDVLYLLWRGIAQYAVRHGARYLIGCSSLTSRDPAHGTAVYEALGEYVADLSLRTEPQVRFRMPIVSPNGASAKVPKLLRTYLAIGAEICGPPAIDREFKTIDFLTLLDLQGLHPRIRVRFLERG